LVGGTTLEWFNDWRFDVALMGASGLDPETGVFTTEPLEASVKVAVMKHARESWLLADASKWQHPAAKRFAEWEVFSRWFVDATRQLQPPRHSNFPCIETV
jgi:DeoR family glycerol-3-phosphate regulon repressor